MTTPEKVALFFASMYIFTFIALALMNILQMKKYAKSENTYKDQFVDKKDLDYSGAVLTKSKYRNISIVTFKRKRNKDV